MNKYMIVLICLLFCSCTSGRSKEKFHQSGEEKKSACQDFKSWAKTPPMGWNSYNSFGATVTESEVRANADYMAAKLKQYGWEYIVIDYCWSYPHPPGSIQDNPPQFRLEKDGAYVPWLAMDEFGRLYPDQRKFPSSYGNLGFKPLGEYIHSLGLKFGIHVMRGIPRQAVWAKSPIKGTIDIDASMIADTTSTCPWLNQMFGVNMNAPGSQEYYNSLADLYASWGVDYIKIDDMLQLGRISHRGPSGAERESNFTEDEQLSHMFLWCIMQSPLMMGGDMTVNTPFVERLLTNAEILEANQNAINPRQLFSEDGKTAWRSDIPGTEDVYMALFNLTDRQDVILVTFDQLGLVSECKVRNLWSRKNLGISLKEFSANLNPHGAKIYRISPKK